MRWIADDTSLHRKGAMLMEMHVAAIFDECGNIYTDNPIAVRLLI